MARAFEARPVRPPAPRVAERVTASNHAVTPAMDFAQLANRLHVGTPVQRRLADGPARDFSGIEGPGRPANSGGLPAGLRADVEARAGLPLDDVRVHRNSLKPRALGALAYAQGRDIHLGPGQEKHLAHEAWHVVQQKQGRVRATGRIGGIAINDQTELEREAADPGRRSPTSDVALPGPTGQAAPLQLYRPLSTDEGRDFLFRRRRGDLGTIGRYVYEADRAPDVGFLFQTRHGPVRVQEADIIGYRPVVGLSHPPGNIRPETEQVEGRRQVFLSEADMSGLHARMRRDPGLAASAVATAYETPEALRQLYPNYEENRGHIERQGIPIVHSFDLSDPAQSAQSLGRLSPTGRDLHFQMPRVPRVPGYSTARLIDDTLDTAARLKASTSIITPHPDSYADPHTHNKIYSLDKQKKRTRESVEKSGGSYFRSEKDDPDQELEDFGYVHKQSTKNQSAKVSKKRKRYRFKYAMPSEHEQAKTKFPPGRDDEDHDPGGDRDEIMV